MASTERRRDRALAYARAIRAATGAELRTARKNSGVSLRAAAGSVGLDFSTLARIERGQLPSVTVEQLALACAAVGLEPSVRMFLRGEAIRDAPQLRLLERLRARLPTSAPWHTEVPMPRPGDLRALDARTVLQDRWIGFEAETQVSDVQAVVRRGKLKKRDAALDVLVLVVSDTVHNRRVLSENRESLRGSFPLDTRAVLSALGRGLPPRDDGIVVI